MVGQWGEVRQVVLSGCRSLRALPESVGQWQALMYLGLGRTNGFEACSSLTALPESVGAWKNMRSLDLSGCESLTHLPNTVGGWSQIACVNLSCCITLADLPEAVMTWPLQDADFRMLLSGCKKALNEAFERYKNQVFVPT